MEFIFQWDKGFKKLLLSVKWANIVQGKLWHCYFPFLVHGFHFQRALNTIDQTHCSSLSWTFPYCAHWRQSSSGIHQLLAVRAFFQAMERCTCDLVLLSSAVLLFSGSCPEGKHWDGAFQKRCFSPARSTQLRKPGLCEEDAAPHYKDGQSLGHKGEQCASGEHAECMDGPWCLAWSWIKG